MKKVGNFLLIGLFPPIGLLCEPLPVVCAGLAKAGD